MCQKPIEQTLYSEEQAKNDYNARLGYGTDQGRWLVEQVAADGANTAGRRPSRNSSRVFHDVNDAESMAPPPVASSASGKSVDDEGIKEFNLELFVRRYAMQITAVVAGSLVLVGILYALS